MLRLKWFPFRAALALGLAGLVACAPASSITGPIYLDEILNEVRVSNADGTLGPARPGAPLGVGAKIASGGNSLAKLNFEGGLAIRLSSNTTLALEDAGPYETARLRLEGGRVRLSLFGRWFGINTAMGLVRTNGFAEVLYLIGPTSAVADDAVLIRCYSGPCSFEANGLNLQAQNLEQVTIQDFGASVTHEQLTALDLRQFTADNPGSALAIASATAAPALTVAAATASSTPTVTATSTPVPTLGFGVAPTATRLTPTFTITARPPTVAASTPTPTAPFIIAPTSTSVSGGGGGGGGGGGNNPTNPPPPATNTQRPQPTNTSPPPTNTSVPPTNTVEPTATEAPTKTPVPSDTPEAPTDTPPPTP
ncbi:MAG: hypothetical protein JNL09_09630 [Anaerolineales bacterium]|nr:hypothetical protein [Anaerolineales bacterium]